MNYSQNFLDLVLLGLVDFYFRIVFVYLFVCF